ncbi:MAG: hypothetical protein JRF55_13495 [Deltaproteobacteria bacterium]|nr:hypothetical protein [Deltaproteobacteria bacterium]
MDAKDWPEDAGRDRLIGDWHIYQRTGGHRTSTDDLITAWYAVHRNPDPPERYLDLGCGVGSVLLMVSHKLRPKIVLGVEAQAQSLMMARRAARGRGAGSIAHDGEACGRGAPGAREPY